jgi:hypothetical protein
MELKKFFEMAGTPPAKPFEAGDTALIVMLGKEPFFAKLRENGTSLSGDFGDVLFSVQKNGRTNGGALSRIAFSVEEAIEMGYVAPIPDKAPVICWDNNNFAAMVCFYDAINNRALDRETGLRCGTNWDNYRQLSDSEARAIWGPEYDSIKSKLED